MSDPLMIFATRTVLGRVPFEFPGGQTLAWDRRLLCSSTLGKIEVAGNVGGQLTLASRGDIPANFETRLKTDAFLADPTGREEFERGSHRGEMRQPVLVVDNAVDSGAGDFIPWRIRT